MTTANDAQIATRGHLRATYLFVWDSFATDPSEVADHVDGVTNTRYARELLGVLVNAGLVAISEGGEFDNEHDVWQPMQTHDEITRDEAESIIDTWLDSKIPNPTTKKGNAMSTSTTRTKKTKNPTGKCLCGCGENSTSNYRPGHDARHAGQVARRLAEKITPKQATDALAALPSEALRLKASAMADRLIDKANAKKATAKVEAKPEPKPTPAPAPAKPKTTRSRATSTKKATTTKKA